MFKIQNSIENNNKIFEKKQTEERGKTKKNFVLTKVACYDWVALDHVSIQQKTNYHVWHLDIKDHKIFRTHLHSFSKMRSVHKPFVTLLLPSQTKSNLI